MDGLENSIPSIRVYVSRLRRRRQRSSTSAPQPPLTNGDRARCQRRHQPDPFSNLREQREEKRKGLDSIRFRFNSNLIELRGAWIPIRSMRRSRNTVCLKLST